MVSELPLIELRNVTKKYRSSQRKSASDTTVTALESVSMDLFDGDFLSVVGPSGGGKTSLLNLLAGLDSLTAGDLLVRGRSMCHRDLDQWRRSSIGIVFQFYHLQPYLNAIDNVALGLTTAGFSRRHALPLARLWLDKVGLSDRANHRPNQLSGGQQQRVAIARAMAKSPELLVADEPTGNLDDRSRSEILDLMVKLNGTGMTVVMVTHDKETAERLSNRIIQIESGRITRKWQPIITNATSCVSVASGDIA